MMHIEKTKMQVISNSRTTLIISMGLLFILAGSIFNEWFLASFFSSDGIIARPHRIIIWITDAVLIGSGILLIIFKRVMSRETLYAIMGAVIVFGAIFFIGKLIPILMESEISDQNRIFLRLVEGYMVFSGLMVIFYRRTIDFKNMILYGITSIFCLVLFLGYDYYRSYSEIVLVRSRNKQHMADNLQSQLFIKDNNLGWKLTENSSVRHVEQGKYNVTYETDAKGFRKINNASWRPDLSIYFFGDSFTFGHGVNNHEAFPAVIKYKYLTEEVNVYNTGVMGYGVTQMFQRFLDEKKRIQPGDLVVFTPISQDIKRNLDDFVFPYFIKFTNILDVEHYPFFQNGKLTYRKLDDTLYNKIEFVMMTADITGKFYTVIRDNFIPDATKSSLEMIKIVEKETTSMGGKFVLFFLPKTGECLNGSYDVDVSGFSFFDIRHFFPSKEEDLNKLKIGGKDNHWNVRGHEMAAKAIVETLINENIIDKKYLKHN